MAFMELEIIRKGALYACDCARCGVSNFTHEWVHEDHNTRRDAMEAGALRCDECGGPVDATTFVKLTRPQYAGRYSASGYLDCTDWLYGSNRRRLERDLRSIYGRG